VNKVSKVVLSLIDWPIGDTVVVIEQSEPITLVDESRMTRNHMGSNSR
jgi:hypothetical protein